MSDTRTIELQAGVAVAQAPSWPGLLISVILHALVLISVPWWTPIFLDFDAILAGSVEEAIELNAKSRRLVWYRIPSIRNPESNSRREHARGKVYSKNEMVVEGPAARRAEQLIQSQEFERELPREGPAENPIAGASAQRAKAFSPPPPRSRTLLADSLEAPPELAAASTPLVDLAAQQAIARLPKPIPRKFRSPDAVPAAPINGQMDFQQSPDLRLASEPVKTFPGMELARLPKPAVRKFTPPQSTLSKNQAAKDFVFESLPQLAAASSPLQGQPVGSMDLSRIPKTKARPGPSWNLSKTSSGAVAGNADFSGLPALGNAGSDSLRAASAALGQANGGKIVSLPRRKISAETLMGTGSSSAPSSAGTGSGMAATPPDLGLVSGNTAGSSHSGAQGATVLGLHSVPGLAPPKAAPPAGFSQGRELGTPEHIGSTDPRAISLPGVSSRRDDTKDLRLLTPEQILGKAEVAEGFFELKLDLAKESPSLSAPLAPNRKFLPRRIEPYFSNRTVFAVVIPMEKVERYSADWIMWFSPVVHAAEPGLPLGNNVRMQAPLPIWKLESLRYLVRGGESGHERRVQMLIEIDRRGRVRMKQLLGRYEVQVNQLVTNDLARWVFQPARQNGQPVDVEAILEIPFRLPESLRLAVQP